MDVPESRAGGPTAKSRWLGPLFAPWGDKEGAVGEQVPACASGTWERWLGCLSLHLGTGWDLGSELSLKDLLFGHCVSHWLWGS